VTVDSSTAALLVFLEEIYRATMTRDITRVHELLQRPLASHLPHEVRAEALTIAAAPAGSFRAPIRLLQLQQRIAQLGDDRAEERTEDDEHQLELELRVAAGGSTIRESGSRRATR
jgi:hypothetical protein